jgi:hypothetical protein
MGGCTHDFQIATQPLDGYRRLHLLAQFTHVASLGLRRHLWWTLFVVKCHNDNSRQNNKLNSRRLKLSLACLSNLYYSEGLCTELLWIWALISNAGSLQYFWGNHIILTSQHYIRLQRAIITHVFTERTCTHVPSGCVCSQRRLETRHMLI